MTVRELITALNWWSDDTPVYLWDDERAARELLTDITQSPEGAPVLDWGGVG